MGNRGDRGDRGGRASGERAGGDRPGGATPPGRNAPATRPERQARRRRGGRRADPRRALPTGAALRPPGNAPRGPGLLHRTRAELQARFGPPVREVERTLIFADGRQPADQVLLHCLLGADGTVEVARIEPPRLERLSREALFALVARYNGGHIGIPQLETHVYAGGLKAWRFANGWWAFPQKDEAGCVRGVKIWHEPAIAPVPAAARPPAPNAEPGDET